MNTKTNTHLESLLTRDRGALWRVRETQPSSAILAYIFRYYELSATGKFSDTSLLSKMQFSSFCKGNSLLRRIQQVWSKTSLNKNKRMVESLQSHGVIESKKVAEIMETVDRALFVPTGTPAYQDSPMKIGTGYITACFALMVGSQGRSIGVEHIPELASTSIKNIEKSAAATLLKDGSLALHVGDGRKGWAEFAPYDAIHVGAAAPEIPQPLIDQLKPGGRLVIPVGKMSQELKVVDKNQDGSVTICSEIPVRYIPLTDRETQLQGT